MMRAFILGIATGAVGAIIIGLIVAAIAKATGAA